MIDPNSLLVKNSGIDFNGAGFYCGISDMIMYEKDGHGNGDIKIY
jgi:hypothetical protein